MPSFTINPLKTGQTPTYYHPSLPNLKQNRPTITFSETGAADSNQKISFYNRENQAQHSTVASKDVMVNNVYVSHDIPPLNDIPLPPLDQGDSSTCQIIPYLHMIQKQLDFPLDYGKFLDCIPAEIPKNTPKDIRTLIISTVNGNWQRYYSRLLNLLFSGSCFAAQTTYQSSCADESQNVDSDPKNALCDFKCVKKGIRIKNIIQTQRPRTADKLCELVNSGQPVTIRRRTQKHIFTIVGCEMVDGKYIFTFNDSDSDPPIYTNPHPWSPDEDILSEYDGFDTIGTLWDKLESMFPVVETCELNLGEDCEEKACEDLGMIYNPDLDGDCKCEDSLITTTPTTPTPPPPPSIDIPL